MEKTKMCKHCQSEIDKKARVCPSCGKKLGGNAKFVIIGIIALFVLIGAFGNKDDKDTKDTANQTANIQKSTNKESKIDETKAANPTEEPTPEPTSEPTAEPTPEPTSEPPKEETPKLTMGQKNALSKANSYLNYSAFSYSGLIEQLEFEGFSNEDATYAVDNCGADWNEQAAIKAQEYLDYDSFSRSGLIEQLEFEGFAKEQAEYGVTEVGY